MARAIGAWTPAPALATPRRGHAAFPPADGLVFFYGGTPVVRPDEHGRGAPALLANGQLLLAGGGFAAGNESNVSHPIAAVQVYDPVANTYTPVAPLATSRLRHTATVLNDGTVLGVAGIPGRGRASAEAPTLSCRRIPSRALAPSLAPTVPQPRLAVAHCPPPCGYPVG